MLLLKTVPRDQMEKFKKESKSIEDILELLTTEKDKQNMKFFQIKGKRVLQQGRGGSKTSRETKDGRPSYDKKF